MTAMYSHLKGEAALVKIPTITLTYPNPSRMSEDTNLRLAKIYGHIFEYDFTRYRFGYYVMTRHGSDNVHRSESCIFIIIQVLSSWNVCISV